MAEGVGFEPTRACALPVFKTGAINHSTTPPDRAALADFAMGRGIGNQRLDNLICSCELIP